MAKNNSVETDIVQGLHYIDDDTGSVIPPIVSSTTYARDTDYALIGGHRSYTRDHNPTYDLPEQMLARLEGGYAARLFSSGMSAGAAVFQALKAGDHVVYPKIMYFGLRGWLLDFADSWGLELSAFDPADPDDLERHVVNDKTRLVWIETPSNPTWDVVDIRKAADIAHAAGAMLAIDSTVATPVLTRPIEHGADIVMHSATKYLNGHSDVLAGALVSKDDSPLWQRICTHRGETGALPGPMDAWLLQRGMRTLFIRVKHICESAMRIAEHFEGHPKLESLAYPGLPSHPGHDIARRQMDGGFSGMMSFLLKGDERDALAFIGRLKTIVAATSLGGVESLVEHRHSIEGPDSPVPPNLVRLSVGLERVEDLIADIQQALG